MYSQWKVLRAPGGEPWFLAGVFVACMCGLMLQIMETRALSVVVYYHLAFFAIGVAMLGMTAGALLVFYRFAASYSPARLFATMARVMTLFAWSVLATLVLLLNLALGAHFVPTLTFVLSWMLAVAVLLPPYILLGITVSLALTRSPLRVSLVYGVDLLGAAAGCLVTLVLLSLIDTYSAILLVGALGAAAALAFSRAARAAAVSAEPAARPGRYARLSAPLALGVLVVAAGTNALLGVHGLRPLVVKGMLQPAVALTEERWNSFSRIDMTMRPNSPARLWSPSKFAPQVDMDQAWMQIDGEAGTPMYRFNGDPGQLKILRYDATALAYYIRHQGRAAIIGTGGGRDLQTAFVFGFRDITGVEYNPIFVRLFARDYRNFSGAGRIQGLRLFVDDARSWFARSHEQFDLIQMSLIDTWAATGAGAFTLSENGLYTVNGWQRFLSRLTPTGVFTVSRWHSESHLDETARILSLAMASLYELGEAHPASHLYLASNGVLSTLVVGRSPLSAEDVRTLDQAVSSLGYRTLAAPGRPAAEPVFDRILMMRSVDELVRFGRTTPINLSPTWDANPFFFNQLRLSDPASMVRALRGEGVMRGNLTASLTLLTLVAVSLVAVVLVLLAPARGAVHEASAPALWWSSLYFLLIGLAFMFVEISLIQRMSLFLGHPVYGLAIVLFGIILATGLGSLLSARAVRLSARSLIGWPLLLAAYLATLPLWLGRVLDQAETGALIERAAVCLLTMVPAGILMGFMFPTGMRLCARVDSHITPWLWAVNGSAGVLATGAAVLVSLETSLNHALWIGAIGYALLTITAMQLLKLAAVQGEPSAWQPQSARPNPAVRASDPVVATPAPD
jgi:spermidine synthase